MGKIDWNNPEEVRKYRREYHRQYDKKNREKKRKYARKYYKENREKERERIKTWREKNKEKVRESTRKWREKNKEKISEYMKKYQRKNKKQRRERYKKKRHEAIDKLGGKCMVCGWADKRALVFDHVKGDGHLDKRGVKGLINWILKTPVEEVKKKNQILCENHNRIKQREREEWRS